MRFLSLFLGCMDVSRPECERLWFLNFNDAPLSIDNYFKF
jgi:hypothetical protein